MTQAVARRITPLLALFALGAVVVLLRLWDVQVDQHTVWADEAARLVHSGREIPYRRGRILDTRGHVLARDKDTHHLVLVYRDFRRGHPLGQVAHARSLLAARPVSLAEARTDLGAWARALVSLSPRELVAFGRGDALETPWLRIPALPEKDRAAAARREDRSGRAQDVGFYVRRLLPLEERQRSRLEKDAREEETDASYLELAARALGNGSTADEVWARLEHRIGGALQRFDRMAGFLDWKAHELERTTPADLLMSELEETRRWVEDATAAKLFAEAAGFVPGRIAAETLITRIDLSWIARELGWDEARLWEWAARTREAWREGWRDGYALPRLIADLRLDPAAEPTPDDYLARVASVFLPGDAVERALAGEPVPWLALPELVVLAELDELFVTRPPRASARLRPTVLPIETPAFREAHAALRERWEADRARLEPQRAHALRLTDDVRRLEREIAIEAQADLKRAAYWNLVDLAWSVDGAAGFHMPADVGAADALPGQALFELLESRLWSAPAHMLALTTLLTDQWDAELQRAIRAELDRLVENSTPSGLVAGRLAIAEELRTRAEERAEFFLKDYGRRLRPLVRGEPSLEVLQYLVNYEDDFAGFRAREAREREYPVLPGDEVRVAPGLIGDVTSIGVDDVLSQREEAAQLRFLKSLPEKSESEREELQRLVGRVLLTDEVKGVAGVEGFWNRELTGRNGYTESRGLEDVYGDGRDDTEFAERVDGEDLILTLDSDLQRAARRTLKSSAGIEDPLSDLGWYRSPVGAAVVLSIDGDVLAAASEPNAESPFREDAKEQARNPIERTLRRPTFQPPGSVIKVLMAAYALSEVGVDPNLPVVCADIGGGAGYVDVHCHSRWGHDVVALERALVVSCNSYFAWLGQTLTDADLRSVSRIFGLEDRTGLLTPPGWDDGLLPRSGFLEHVGGMNAPGVLPFGDHDRRLAGNGLGVVQVTPMQLARAVLGLATGELRDLRLVRRIGDTDLPHGKRSPLGIEESALEFVRRVMVGVVSSQDPNRTGKVLAPDELGFQVAVKTGSADLSAKKRRFRDKLVVPKHTWVAGWAPADDPEIVFVVFVHNTLATSSHGAVYLARELLRQPELLAYLQGRGVDLSQVPALGSFSDGGGQ